MVAASGEALTTIPQLSPLFDEPARMSLSITLVPSPPAQISIPCEYLPAPDVMSLRAISAIAPGLGGGQPVDTSTTPTEVLPASAAVILLLSMSAPSRSTVGAMTRTPTEETFEPSV